MSTEEAWRAYKAECTRRWYHSGGKDKMREWYDRTREERNAQRREKYQTDPAYRERVLEKNRRYYMRKQG
ncbi:hypothetical protein BSL82_00540 [Tardibacter chloracetimidivorans]|uniref:Uncharacterized protein n=1 Tax=Tardibacter chloracetimidivorans TaxID=1921510 RepID=A0A1L3ZQS3_9SPHN|nr:hypothetical protein [Tardibacter chloracetimidivorans]API57976.1 hypothetical protein BSL82_00540 [Tardibacter chloracetimidivorans]